jgi:hypothetical protein
MGGGAGGMGGMGGMFGGGSGGTVNVSNPVNLTDWTAFFGTPNRYAQAQPNMYANLFGANNGQQVITGQATQYNQPAQPQYQSDPNTQYNAEGVANAISTGNTQRGWRNYDIAPTGTNRMNFLSPITNPEGVVTQTPTAQQIGVQQPVGNPQTGFNQQPITPQLQGLSNMVSQFSNQQNQGSTNNLG